MKYHTLLGFCLLSLLSNHTVSQVMPMQDLGETVVLNTPMKAGLITTLLLPASKASITGHSGSLVPLWGGTQGLESQYCVEPGPSVNVTGSNIDDVDFADTYLAFKTYAAAAYDYKSVPNREHALKYLNPHHATYKKYFQALPDLPRYAADTSGQKLRILKKGRFIYDDQPPQKIWSGLNYSEAYEAVMQKYPEAYLESKKARYNAYGMMVGLSVVTILSAIELAKTIDDAKKVNSGMLVDGGFKVGDLVPLLIASGFTIYFGVKSKKHSKKAVAIVNRGY